MFQLRVDGEAHDTIALGIFKAMEKQEKVLLEGRKLISEKSGVPLQEIGYLSASSSKVTGSAIALSDFKNLINKDLIIRFTIAGTASSDQRPSR